MKVLLLCVRIDHVATVISFDRLRIQLDQLLRVLRLFQTATPPAEDSTHILEEVLAIRRTGVLSLTLTGIPRWRGMTALRDLNWLFFEKFRKEISGQILSRSILHRLKSNLPIILSGFIPDILQMGRLGKYLFVMLLTIPMFVLIVEVIAIIEKVTLPLEDALLADLLTELHLRSFFQLYHHPRSGILLLLGKDGTLLGGLPHSDSPYYHAQQYNSL